MGLKNASVFGKKETGLAETTMKRTRWTAQAEAGETWKEYPRPTMVRENWINLNGWWEYAFTGEDNLPKEYDGKILVPFSPESPLSGVERQLQPNEYLWYRRTVTVPAQSENRHYLLHFGAVDQSCTIFVDGEIVGAHVGGYLPFTIDLGTCKSIVNDHGEWTFTLTVRVRDLSDTSYHSRGKQKLKRGGMYYTAQSGIWQTVWMEMVPSTFIDSLKWIPCPSQKYCLLAVTIKGMYEEELRVTVPGTQAVGVPLDKEMFHTLIPSIDVPAHLECLKYRSKTANSNAKTFYFQINLENPHLWSPEDPYLYPLRVVLGTQEEDAVTSYFAMRQLSIKSDEHGIPRFYLNGKLCLQFGVLDQGYWPDGLYTAPSDEAFIYDIQTMKDLGFNMIRKHIKIEPERWYYHCDRLGMLVWQDMVNGGTPYHDWFVTYLATLLNLRRISVRDGKRSRHLFSRANGEGREAFLQEMKQTVTHLNNHPSIICWCPFNEGWGQFDAKNVASRLRAIDQTRFIDHASGWFDQKGGDVVSVHHYFFRLYYRTEKRRVAALTEFGGYTWQVPDHSFSDRLYGYGNYSSRSDLTKAIRTLFKKEVLAEIPKGMSAFIYTQLSDVEDEANGLLTYDREVVKPQGRFFRS